MSYEHAFAYTSNPDFHDEEWRPIVLAMISAVENIQYFTRSKGGCFPEEFSRNLIAATWFSEDNKPHPIAPDRGEWVIASSSTVDGSLTFTPSPVSDVMGKDAISFCGVREGRQVGEKFRLTKTQMSSNLSALQSCRTDRADYDVFVCVALIVVDHIAPGRRLISSDGNAEDWWPALRFVRQFLFPEATLPNLVDPDRVSEQHRGVMDNPFAPVVTPIEVFRKGADKPASLFF